MNMKINSPLKTQVANNLASKTLPQPNSRRITDPKNKVEDRFCSNKIKVSLVACVILSLTGIAYCIKNPSAVSSFIENRGGISQVVGFKLLPAQTICPRASESKATIEKSLPFIQGRIDPIEARIGTHVVKGIIHYPSNIKSNDGAILYNNGNAATVANYFQKGSFSFTPARFANMFDLPIVMYDYRGAGLSSENTNSWGLEFRANYRSLIDDGKAMLKHALDHFQTVLVIGSSLGGGIGTIALSEYLTEHPSDVNRVSLINHDSFTTTSRVVIPNFPNFADHLGWVVGGLLNVTHAMENLIKLKVRIAVFCHDQDPVIPKGARMADWIESFSESKNHPDLTICRDTTKAHADLEGFCPPNFKAYANVNGFGLQALWACRKEP